MPPAPLYALLTFWLPVVTAVGLASKLFLVIRSTSRTVKSDIRAWADRLLENHMVHIQQAVENSAASLNEMAETSREFSVTMRELREDFQASYAQSNDQFSKIMQDLATIKAKVD